MQFLPAPLKFQAATEPLASLLIDVAAQATLAVQSGPHLTHRQRESLERVAAAALVARRRLADRPLPSVPEFVPVCDPLAAAMES